jgi:RND superfamily putative drug exporter
VGKELWLGTTLSIIVDATFIHTLLIPATMHLLGRWNWWPAQKAEECEVT